MARRMMTDDSQWVFGLSVDDQLSWALARVNPGNDKYYNDAFPDLKFPHGFICDLPNKSDSEENTFDFEKTFLTFFGWLREQKHMSRLLNGVASVGVSTMGITDSRARRLIDIRRKNLKWAIEGRGDADYVLDFQKLVTKAFQRPMTVTVHNDATAKCLAAYRFQPELRGKDTLCYIYLSLGINMGLANEFGAVYTSRHPEIGHARPALNEHDNGNSKAATYGGCPAHIFCFEGLTSAARIRGEWGDDLPRVPMSSPAWKVISDYVGQLCWNAVLYTSADIILIAGPSACERLVKGARERVGGLNVSNEVNNAKPYVKFNLQKIRVAEPIMASRVQNIEGIMGALELARMGLVDGR